MIHFIYKIKNIFTIKAVKIRKESC